MDVHSARSVVTLVFFVISIFFILFPVRIPHSPISLNLATAPPLCVIILLASTCIPISVVWDGIRGTDGVKPYNILILFFGLAYMSISLDMTGILQAAAFWVSNKGGRSGFRLYTYFFLMSLALAVILGNDPVILSGTAFLTYFTKVAEVEPLSFLIAEFASCNIGSMVLFVGNPTNVVLCEGFGLGYLAFSAWTLIPFVGCAVAAYVVLLIQFRNRVPKIILAPELNPKSVLTDSIAASVGVVLISCCLITIIGVSFVGVDVWEIALPFAVGKVVFDIAWDDYKFRQGKLPSQCEKDPVDGLTDNHVPLSQHTDRVSRLRTSLSVLLSKTARYYGRRKARYPVFLTTLERLPFPLLSFTFSQFMLVEALVYHNWTRVFAGWLSHLTIDVPATVFSVGFISVVLCGIAGTNILSTILLTKIIHQYSTPLDERNLRAASIALAVGSNVGAISVVFSASLAGLLWRGILKQKRITMTTGTFAKWNWPICCVVMAVGLSIVYAEVEVYYGKIATM